MNIDRTCQNISGNYVNSPMKLFHINEYLNRDIIKTDNIQGPVVAQRI